MAVRRAMLSRMAWLAACLSATSAPVSAEEPHHPRGAADVAALPEPFRGWFRLHESPWYGPHYALGAVDRDTWERWQRGYDPLSDASRRPSVWTIELAPSRGPDKDAWYVLHMWLPERRQEVNKSDLPAAPPPRVNGDALVSTPAVQDDWDCRDMEPVGGWRPDPSAPPGAGLTLRALGGDRALASFCGGSVEVVIGESADQRFDRWVAEETAKRIAELSAVQPDLRVDEAGAVTWRGEPVTCRLGFDGCDPTAVVPYCVTSRTTGPTDESAIRLGAPPKPVGVKFGANGPELELALSKCVDTALVGL